MQVLATAAAQYYRMDFHQKGGLVLSVAATATAAIVVVIIMFLSWCLVFTTAGPYFWPLGFLSFPLNRLWVARCAFGSGIAGNKARSCIKLRTK